MYTRSFWQMRLEDAWTRRSVLWLMGVRRAGKTFLCRSLSSTEYFDCELPRVRRRIEDSEAFLSSLEGKRVVLDEVHRLHDPAELLKIAADHFPSVRILATGASTLGASSRFRDTLAGRKEEIWLTPMTWEDTRDFGRPDLERRLSHGGLPPFFLEDQPPERDFQSWIDDYWATDILELFRLERRASFMRFFELLTAQSGGIFTANRFATPCEVSRTTIANYLAVLEATFVMHVLRPFTRSRKQEIVSAPKVYAFDTGFVAAFRGWQVLRPEDRGLLWEHLVLNELHAQLQSRRIHYWRTKHGNEIDFVLAPPGKPPIAIECKSSVADFDPRNLGAFRRRYPRGRNLLVASDARETYDRDFNGLAVTVTGLEDLAACLGKA